MCVVKSKERAIQILDNPDSPKLLKYFAIRYAEKSKKEMESDAFSAPQLQARDALSLIGRVALALSTNPQPVSQEAAKIILEDQEGMEKLLFGKKAIKEAERALEGKRWRRVEPFDGMIIGESPSIARMAIRTGLVIKNSSEDLADMIYNLSLLVSRQVRDQTPEDK